MKKIQYLLVVLVLATAIACGGEQVEQKPKTAKEARTLLSQKRQKMNEIKKEMDDLQDLIAELDPESVKEKEVNVKIDKLVVKDFNHYVEVQGNVMTAQDPAFASSETGGRITELKVKEGDFVKKGSLIAIINLESINKSIAQIDKSLELARDIYNRQKNLWEQNIGSEIQYLQAKNQVESLEKNKESLEFELTKANVYAPASGYIDMVMSKTGEMAGPGAPIVQILNTNALKVVAAVPEIYLGNVKRGEKVTVTFPALDAEQNARVIAIGRTINPTNRTFEVEATVGTMNGMLKPNLLATMLVNDYAAKDVVVIPDELIQQDVSGATFVMTVENKRAAKKVITLGKTYRNETIVSTGLTGNEVLITKGATSVSDGDLVKIIE
jgi:RND family efflux transporter MFP subunit